MAVEDAITTHLFRAHSEVQMTLAAASPNVVAHAHFRDRSVCELCGSDNSETLFKREMSHPTVWSFIEAYYEGRVDDVVKSMPFEVAKCVKCHFVWQRWVLGDKLMSEMYEYWISSEHSHDKKRRGNPVLFRKYAQESAEIAELVDKQPSDINVLDFGMGWGYWAQMAKAFGYKVFGYELSEERSNHARSMGIDVLNSLDDLGGRRFDFINSEQVFEHICDPLETLSRLTKALDERGVIRIAVPDGKNDIAAIQTPSWRASKNSLHPLEHINCFTHETLTKMASRAGLSVEWTSFPTLRRMRDGILGDVISLVRSRIKPRGTALHFRKS